jgi:hypothetical protein
MHILYGAAAKTKIFWISKNFTQVIDGIDRTLTQYKHGEFQIPHFNNNNRLVPTKGALSQWEALDTIDPQTGSADVLPWNKFRIQQA